MLRFGQRFVRLRAPLIADPYSAADTRRDWDHPETFPIDGLGFDPGGSVVTDLVNRSQVVTSPTLFWVGDDVPDITVDDRLRGPDGSVWHVTGHPSVPVHPWTGWAPGASWPIEKVEG